MQSNSESQCYFVQLQIDGYLDGDLNEAQRGAFVSHVQDCAACASEFHYAQTIQDAVIDLPQIECSDTVLEPIHRIVRMERQASAEGAEDSFLTNLARLLLSIPLYIRYGVPGAAVALIAIVLSSSVMTPTDVPSQLVAAESAEQYTAQEISQALEELNVAIDYLNQLSQRTEVMIGERFLVNPLQDSINASFEKAGLRDNDPLQNGPI